VNYNYHKRDYLLPPGCKDLIDALKGFKEDGAADISVFEIKRQADGFIVTFKLADLRAGDIDIVIEGRNLRIFCKASGGGPPKESVMVVPPDYDMAKALATYIDDTLRIFIPKS
jgi:hypothetical protein